jgi:hypothetical protein
MADKQRPKAVVPCRISWTKNALSRVLKSFKKGIHFKGALNLQHVRGAVQGMGASAST